MKTLSDAGIENLQVTSKHRKGVDKINSISCWNTFVEYLKDAKLDFPGGAVSNP